MRPALKRRKLNAPRVRLPSCTVIVPALGPPDDVDPVAVTPVRFAVARACRTWRARKYAAHNETVRARKYAAHNETVRARKYAAHDGTVSR